MTSADALKSAEELGFSHVGELCMESLRFLPEIRQMCEANRCGAYGKCWTCPPHCGSLEEIAEKAAAYTHGILVQTTGRMEDDFDIDCMQDTERLHRQRFHRLAAALREQCPDCLPMGAGGCRLCEVCGCPDEPCRHPDQAISSMEAYGLFVSEVCERSGLPYYYGPKTITYTACVLLK